jgi:excisionase family DNA binding protein
VTRERRLITVKEAAAYLNISQSTVYRMLARGEITALKIGSDWFFEYAKIDQWLDARPPGKVSPEKHRASPRPRPE